MFEKQTELPDVNSSINKGAPASGDKGNEDDVQNVTQTVAKVHLQKQKNHQAWVQQCGLMGYSRKSLLMAFLIQ